MTDRTQAGGEGAAPGSALEQAKELFARMTPGERREFLLWIFARTPWGPPRAGGEQRPPNGFTDPKGQQ